MSGQVIPILSLTEYDFANLGDGSTQELIAKRKIDTSQYPSGVLQARLHDTNWDGNQNSPSVDITVYQDGFTEDDPTKEFISTTIATVQFVEGTDSDNTMKAAALDDAALTHMVAVKIKATGGDHTTFTVELSIDLVSRDS